MVSRTEALAAYLALGKGTRSLIKLHAELSKKGKAPSIATLGLWSKKGQWVLKASEHDETVERKTSDKVAEKTAGEAFDAVQAFTAAARLSLKRAMDILESEFGGIGGPDSAKKLIEAARQAYDLVKELAPVKAESAAPAGGNVVDFKSQADALRDRIKERVAQG